MIEIRNTQDSRHQLLPFEAAVLSFLFTAGGFFIASQQTMEINYIIFNENLTDSVVCQ